MPDHTEPSPINSFSELSDAIVHQITNSQHEFITGIYGDWGTGKTTLMQQIEKKLSDNGDETTVVVWFSAWRYERESYHATIPLLKTIVRAVSEKTDAKNVNRLLKILGTLAIGTLNKQIVEPTTGEFIGDVFRRSSSEAKWKNMVKNDTVYYDTLEEISKELKKLNICKIVIFIDDLDRCSPQKALEVLESVKVFLDVKKLFFVFGISYDIIVDLVRHTHEHLHVDGVKYIQKIIQVPISLPQWTDEMLTKLFSDIVSRMDITEISDMAQKIIFEAVDKNPRQLKRLLNCSIIATSTYFGKNNPIDLDTLFILGYVGIKHKTFFQTCLTNLNFRKKIMGFFEEWHKLNTSFQQTSEPQDSDLHKLNKAIMQNLPTSEQLTSEQLTPKQLKTLLIAAFREYLFKHHGKLVESDTARTLNPPPFTSAGASMFVFSMLLQKKEILNMSPYDWLDLSRKFVNLDINLNLNLYFAAVNLMREDLEKQLNVS